MEGGFRFNIENLLFGYSGRYGESKKRKRRTSLSDVPDINVNIKFEARFGCLRVNPVRKGGALNPILNKEWTFFSSSPP